MILLTQKAQSQSCPDSPIIVGSTSLCRSIGNYQIINFNASFSTSYLFNIFPAGAGTISNFNLATGTFNVNWLVTTPCTLVVSLPPTCQGADTLFMQNCCDVNGLFSLVDPAITNLPGVTLQGNEYTVTNQTFTIEGTLSVNSPLNLVNCTVSMGPGSRIDVYNNSQLANGALVLTATTLTESTNCNAMWEGIRLFNNTQLKTEVGPVVTISGAQSAIAFYGNAGYHFKASQTRLLNNYRGILASSKYPTSIIVTELADCIGLTITGGNTTLPINTFNGQNPLPVNRTSFVGMDIINCNPFDLDGMLGQNTIQNLSYGIRVWDSNVSLDRVLFTNIFPNNSYPFADAGTAILARRLTSSNNYTINVPSLANPTLTSSFTGCNQGININGSYHLNTKGNSFTNVNQYGIRVRNAINNSMLTINNTNVFTNVNVGVNIENCTNANAIINHNTFTSTVALTSPTNDNIAIFISNAMKVEMDWQIVENTITGYRLGVYVRNSQKRNLGFNPIRYNNILFNRVVSSSTFNFMGIWLEHIEDINLSNNLIDYNQTPVSQALSPRLRGLNIKDIKVGTISSNEIKNMGIAMRFVGDNRPLTLQCNIMDACENGVFLNNAALINQGTPISPWDNQWRNFGTHKRVYGTLLTLISQMNWYFKSSNSDFSPLSSGAPLWLIPLVADYNSPCDDAIDPGDGDPEGMVDFLRAIVADSASIPNDSLDFLFRLQLFAYTTLEENDSLRELLPEFMNFYAEQLSSTIARLVNAENAIEKLDYSTATIQLNAATCVETASLIMQKTLNAIREYDLMGNDCVEDMPLTLREDLEAIAYLPSSIYGVGVFYARAILNLEVDDENIGLRIKYDDLIIQENKSPRCFDKLGRQIGCPDKSDFSVIKKKTKLGDFIIVK
jgi:hypothetical protein